MRRPAPRIALPSVLVVLLAAALAAGCGRADLDAYDVKLAAAGVQSNSADAALTARGAAQGDSTAAFTREHADELALTAARTAEQLGAAHAEPSLASRVRTLARISAQTSAELRRLAAAPSQRSVAASVAARCGALAAQAKGLADR